MERSVHRFGQSNAKSKSKLKYANKIVKWFSWRKCLKFVSAFPTSYPHVWGRGSNLVVLCGPVAWSANYGRENFCRTGTRGPFLSTGKVAAQRKTGCYMRASNQSVQSKANKYPPHTLYWLNVLITLKSRFPTAFHDHRTRDCAPMAIFASFAFLLNVSKWAWINNSIHFEISLYHWFFARPFSITYPVSWPINQSLKRAATNATNVRGGCIN